MASEPNLDPATDRPAVPPPPSAGEDEAFSIGRYLARQRVLREITVEDLSQITKLPVRSIERLESGSYDRDTDGFVRGFVRTVSVALGLDPVDTLTRMLSEPGRSNDYPRVGELGLPRLALMLAALLAIAGSAGVIRSVASSDVPEVRPDQQVIYRRDPVRALAEAERENVTGPAPLLLLAPRTRPDPGEPDVADEGAGPGPAPRVATARSRVSPGN